MARALLALVAALTVAAPAHAALPPVKHVFIIVLENKDFDQSFAKDSPAQYISRTLPSKGQVLEQYYGTSHVSLGNYISMVSGLAPNPDTQTDCNQSFKDVFPGTLTADGQVMGAGCVYPREALTVADQLEEKGLSWKGYMQDMGNSTTDPKTCRHPAIGDTDETQKARNGDQYATRHNPFVYFHSIIDDQAGCDARDVPLDQLPQDLKSARTTPNYVFITPNLCEDGHDEPCVDGRPGGLVSADAFVKAWAPLIMRSAAYRSGGMLLVTWDEGNIAGGKSSAACCGEKSGPNTLQPGLLGPGGGRTGTVVVSPFTQPRTRNSVSYNHYSLLRSVEDLFGLKHLGYAGREGLKPFGDDVFNAFPVGSCTAGRGFLGGALVRGRTLVVTPRRSGPLSVRLAGRPVTAPSRLVRCVTTRIALPARHGALQIKLGTQKRTLKG